MKNNREHVYNDVKKHQHRCEPVEIGIELSDECLALIQGGSQNIDANQVMSGINQISSGLNQVSNGLGLGNL